MDTKIDYDNNKRQFIKYGGCAGGQINVWELHMVAVLLGTSRPKIDEWQNNWVTFIIYMRGNYTMWLCSWLPE